MVYDLSTAGFKFYCIENLREESVGQKDDNVKIEEDIGPSASEAFASLEAALN